MVTDRPFSKKSPPIAFGTSDATYQALGGLEGIQQLVYDFYRAMETLPEAKHIRAMHSADLAESARKLVYFLSDWTGGPKLYAKHYGSISIPLAHRHLSATESDRDAWLMCMKHALASQSYSVELQAYLLKQLAVPAQRIVDVAQSK